MEGEDSLHYPRRLPDHSLNLTSAFLKEIKDVSSSVELKSPFKETFEVEKMRDERILHWLMRTSLEGEKAGEEVLEASKLLWIGDAAHTMPILGGEGAQWAIDDGKVLGDWIKDGKRLEGWYKERVGVWKEAVRSERALGGMHGLRSGVSSL